MDVGDAMSFDTYRSRVNSTGGSLRNEAVAQSRKVFEDSIADDPSFRSDVEIIRSGEAVGLINLRMDNRRVKNSAPTMDLHDVINNHIKFKLGDVLHTTTVEEAVEDDEDDETKEEYWICTESSTLHSTLRTGECEECNLLLRWQNPTTFEIIERWASARDPYTAGINEGKIVSTGGGKYKVKIPHDSETALFHLDRRFLIDIANNEPIAYKIVKYDSTTNRYAARDEGFLVIFLDQDETRPEDNFDLMIADYQESPPPPIPSVGSCEIVFVGTATLRVGSSKDFAAVFYDSAGNEISDIAAAWELVLPDGISDSYIQMVNDPGSANLAKLQATGGIGSKVILKMSADSIEHGMFSAEVELTIVPLF